MTESLPHLLCKELDIPCDIDPNSESRVAFQINRFPIQCTVIDPEILLFSPISPPPKENREEFFIKTMQANFLGQGTGGSVIGLNEDESFLTLSLSLPYEVSYDVFKERLEEFVNFLDFWKQQIQQFET